MHDYGVNVPDLATVSNMWVSPSSHHL